MAEREGFEPPDLLKGQLISSQPHSTTLAPLQISCCVRREHDAAALQDHALGASPTAAADHIISGPIFERFDEQDSYSPTRRSIRAQPTIRGPQTRAALAGRLRQTDQAEKPGETQV